MQEKCLICKKISEGDIKNLVYQDDKVLVNIAEDWVIKGHIIVAPKRHVINISDLTEEEYKYFSSVVYRTEKALLEILSKNKSIIFKSGGFVPHLHFHIYPIMDTTAWQEIKDMLDLKLKYEAEDKEKVEFFNAFRDALSKG